MTSGRQGHNYISHNSLVSVYDEWQASEQHNRLAEIIETADRVNDDVTPSITPPNMPRSALLTDAELERIDRGTY